MEPNNTPKQPVRPVNPAGAGVPPRPVASRPVASRPVAPRPTARPVAPRPAPSAPAAEPKEANEPTFDNGPSVVGKKERKTGWILAIILLFIIAAGGVGFGVWAYLDSNTQKDQLNSQINDLQQQNAELQDELSSGATSSDVVVYSNPVLDGSNGKAYHLSYESPAYSLGVNNEKILDLGVENGALAYCWVRQTGTAGEECTIPGLSGEIYNIIDFTLPAQSPDLLNIGFIMTDGSVEYVSFMDVMQNGNFEVKKLNLDDYVINAVTVGGKSSDPVDGSGVVTLFVLRDGSFVEIDESMLQ